MAVESEHRASDSPYVARVWRGSVSGVASMTSVATTTWELVFWEEDGIGRAAVRGPETSATTVATCGDSTSFGISFAHGVSMPHLPMSRLVDGEIACARAGGGRFVLQGEEWEVPSPDDAEHFVDKLVRAGVLVRDPLVEEVVWGGIARVGTRSVQRRVVAATGLPQGTLRQIERARHAAVLLRDGSSALDVVHRLGFYDQPHLARSLRRFIGRTATQLSQGAGADDPMSLLYKTGV